MKKKLPFDETMQGQDSGLGIFNSLSDKQRKMSIPRKIKGHGTSAIIKSVFLTSRKLLKSREDVKM